MSKFVAALLVALVGCTTPPPPNTQASALEQCRTFCEPEPVAVFNWQGAAWYCECASPGCNPTATLYPEVPPEPTP